MDLERLAWELSLTISKRVLTSGDQGVFIPELGRKIRSVSQLTSQQFASLTNKQCFQILSYMANDPKPLEGRLEHHCGRHQPREEESSSTDPPPAQPSEADQEASSEAQNISKEISRAEVVRLKHGRTRVGP